MDKLFILLSLDRRPKMKGNLYDYTGIYILLYKILYSAILVRKCHLQCFLYKHLKTKILLIYIILKNVKHSKMQHLVKFYIPI